MRIKLEFDIPDTDDLVLAEEDYDTEAAKITMQIKEGLQAQMSPVGVAPLNAKFLRDTFLLGKAFAATGSMLKALAIKYAERGRFND